ncbi:hypothetical protein Tco_0533158 [Tanacetum coccineum]
MPFKEGKLPFKYLGVPLNSSRLLHQDCQILVERVQNRTGDCKNKSLSFMACYASKIEDIRHAKVLVRNFVDRESIHATLDVIIAWIKPWARNSRLFKKEKGRVDQVQDSIVEIVRLKLITVRFKKSSKVAKMKAIWDIRNT